MARNFLDPSYFTGPDEALDVFSDSMRNVFDYGTTIGPVFFARVLTPPLPLSAAQMSAIAAAGAEGEANGKRLTKFVFKGRIEELHGDFLDDPCDLSTAPDEEARANIRRLISQHTEFVGTTEGVIPSKNDIVKVELQRGPTGAWDVQYGRYIGMTQELAIEPVKYETCVKLQETFAEAEDTSYGVRGLEEWLEAPIIEPQTPAHDENEEPITPQIMSDGTGIGIGIVPNDIIEDAEKYDIAARKIVGFSNSRDSGDFRMIGCSPAANFGDRDRTPEKAIALLDQLHEVMRLYTKAVAWRAWDQLGVRLNLNVTYRSAAESKKLRRAFDKCVAEQKKKGADESTILSTCTYSAAGFSYHNFGLGVDFNPQGPADAPGFSAGDVWGGGWNTILKKADRSIWIDSGMVKIIEDTGLTWGGRWSGTGYDPVHMGFDTGAGQRILGYTTTGLYALAEEQGLNPDIEGNKVVIG